MRFFIFCLWGLPSFVSEWLFANNTWLVRLSLCLQLLSYWVDWPIWMSKGILGSKLCTATFSIWSKMFIIRSFDWLIHLVHCLYLLLFGFVHARSDWHCGTEDSIIGLIFSKAKSMTFEESKWNISWSSVQLLECIAQTFPEGKKYWCTVRENNKMELDNVTMLTFGQHSSRNRCCGCLQPQANILQQVIH